MALRGLGVAAVGGGLVSAIGWLAPFVLLGAVAMAIAAVCWVLNDHERPRRLALLIRAWRTQQPGQNSTAPARGTTTRRRGAAKAASRSDDSGIAEDFHGLPD